MAKKRQSHPPTPGANASGESMPRRLWAVDAFRGAAILMMVFYHLGFDLNYLGWIHYDINNDLRWLAARTLILGSFLWLVGVSLAIAETQAKNMRQKLRRVGKLVVAAALVTVGSGWLLPQLTIYFGTLHAIALMSLVLLTLPLPPRWAGPLGLVCIGLGLGYSHPAFDTPLLAWLGLMTHKPQTADYVPMLPWFGVCLIGYAAAKTLVGRPLGATKQPIPGGVSCLAWLGRHSLAIYLLHQPLLLGMLIPVTRLLKSA